jgi:hypothetical protein
MNAGFASANHMAVDRSSDVDKLRSLKKSINVVLLEVAKKLRAESDNRCPPRVLHMYMEKPYLFPER